MSPEIVWTIAGSDSGGGAGIQADLHTFHALGVHGCSVITAITAQNTVSVEDVLYVPAHMIMQQINALSRDLMPKAIKIGMLGNIESIKQLGTFLATYDGKVVLDPVMVASSGDALFDQGRTEYIQALGSLYPYIDLITPNIPEAEMLTGMRIHTYADIEKAAAILLSQGVKHVLIKGGHFRHDVLSQDYWADGVWHTWLASRRVAEQACHGTGCTLSSAIAACLARDMPFEEALVMAKMYVSRGIARARLTLMHAPMQGDQAYLPYMTQQPLVDVPEAFPACHQALGLYPIVDSAAWLEKLLPAGVRTIQLRIKEPETCASLSAEIQRAVEIAEQYHAQLFINDYWELAIQHKAYGVHLGQEDLLTADIQQIRRAGLRLGVSTHSYAELAAAHACRPSYVAFGPIFPTNSKQMPFAPQGLAKLREMRACVQYPLVAIGGIGDANIMDVIETGVDGVAMISAITQAPDPALAVKHYAQLCAESVVRLVD